MPDESPQETFPQEAAGRLHSPSSRPLTDSFPERSGIGDFDLSRLPKPACYPQNRYTIWRSKLLSRVPSLESLLPQPELHGINWTASTRTSRLRPNPSDYGHIPESGPRMLGIRALYPKTLASSVPGAFPLHSSCCYSGGQDRWI
ncbi:hypothetical protein T07_1619 [Trichinella nelsoni]|uniref:Uncharacterized protein n=1 Tax=Trichinella nelsoni TaxID=6336 RepID=A0A0V0RGQ8_9BILA|nr:hypothetical protein T07_1619 [Trichinella nelsoni]